MGEPVRIWCGPDQPLRGSGVPFKRTVCLNTDPLNGNVHLKFDDLRVRLEKELPDLAVDILEIGSYVYCADQTVSRGGDRQRGDGKDWYRSLHFEIPVRRLDIWQRPEVVQCLSETLSILSDDYFVFRFRHLTKDYS